VFRSVARICSVIAHSYGTAAATVGQRWHHIVNCQYRCLRSRLRLHVLRRVTKLCLRECDRTVSITSGDRCLKRSRCEPLKLWSFKLGSICFANQANDGDVIAYNRVFVGGVRSYTWNGRRAVFSSLLKVVKRPSY